MRAARGAHDITDLEAPRPTLDVRAGLTAVAFFGVLTRPQVDRAVTAVFAAGMSARARTRAGAATAAPASAHVGVRIPFALTTPPGGHGTTVAGALLLSLASVDIAAMSVAATPAITLELDVADTDAWLLGGPGTTPIGGALPLELRRLTARVHTGLYGGPSSAEVVLHEGAALGAEWARLVVRPPAVVTGSLELEPLLPEAQAVITALCTRLAAAAPGSPAAMLLALLKAAGVSRPDGALLPDGLAHLLHDAGAQLRAAVALPAGRTALLQSVAGLLPTLSVSGDGGHIAAGPLTADVDLAARTVSFKATAGDGLLRWRATGALSAAGVPTYSIRLGDPATDAFALAIAGAPLRAELVRDGGAAAVPIWPTAHLPDLGRLAAAAVPAEALRVVLEGLRTVDTQLGSALDDLCAALGMLRPPDGNGHRAVIAPLRLFEEPAAWLAQAGVLSVASGGPFDTDRVVELLEAVKPFVGLAGTGTPRGVLPIAPGLEVGVEPAAQGPSVYVGVDPSSWLGTAGRPPFAAGLRAGLTIPAAGPPLPSVSVFVGVPDGPGGTTTAQHRRAAHLVADAAGLRLFLRPSVGADVEIYPTLAGLGSLIAAGGFELLPRALNEVASMNADAVRAEIAALVGAVGRGLDIAAGTPAQFDATKMSRLAADPAARLRARLPELLAEAAAALDPVLRRLVGATTPVAVLSGGVLTVTVRTVVARITSSPFSVSLTGSVTGLPVIDAVALSMAVDGTRLSAWSAGVGPARVDLGGPMLRPFLRGGLDATTGWGAELGLGLDALAPTAVGHRELVARWREATADVDVIATERTATGVTEDTTDDGVAVAAIGAVLDLVGGWVLGVAEVRQLLAKEVGPAAPPVTTVRSILEGSILDPAAPATAPRLMPQVLTDWPGKLLTIASRLAAAAPKVVVDEFSFSIANTGGVLGVSMTTTNAAGIELTSGGDLSLVLEVDASWIEPPSGNASPGVVLSLLRIDATTITPAPGLRSTASACDWARSPDRWSTPGSGSTPSPSTCSAASSWAPAATPSSPAGCRSTWTGSPCRLARAAGATRSRRVSCGTPAAAAHRRVRRSARPSPYRSTGRAWPSPCARAAATVRGSCRSSARSGRSTSTRSASAWATAPASRRGRWSRSASTWTPRSR
jgi:hypothetical protein